MSTQVEQPSRGILIRSASFPSQHPDSDRDSHQSLPGAGPSISFAPLPPPTKRSKSHRRRPLGVAGRSTILAQQNRLRRHHHDQDQDQYENGYPRSRHHDRRPEIHDDDDALIELARLVKDAGKKIWKSLSRPGGPQSTNATAAPAEPETQTIQLPDQPPDPDPEPIPTEEGHATPVEPEPQITEDIEEQPLDSPIQQTSFEDKSDHPSLPGTAY